MVSDRTPPVNSLTYPNEFHETIDHALKLASLGLRVLPLRPASKEPCLKRWQHRATADPAKIYRWFRRDGADRNLGLLTGRGLVVLDLDPGRGGTDSFEGLTKNRSPPTTATSRTGSGGLHYLFRTARSIGNRVDVLPGLDVRGQGGMIVVPPSIHPNGNRYEWLVEPRAGIADLPMWLRKAIEAARSPGPSIPPEPGRKVILDRSGEVPVLLAEMLDRFPILAVGRRNDQMCRAIGSLAGRGFEPDLIRAVMLAWHARGLDLGKTSTDLVTGAREIDACIRSTIESEKFSGPAGTSHQEQITMITLSEEQERKIRKGKIPAGTMPAAGAQTPPDPPNGKSRTQNSWIGNRLCVSRDEIAFVEALVVHVTHKIRNGEFATEGAIFMTNNQILAIANERHGMKWESQQLERLKRKFISRPNDGKPATRYELLLEIVKGSCKRNEAVGVPSEYRATGILGLIESE